ncbi:MAG: phosphoribosylformylglycinamidine synthase [Treponema sp.]|jgi:phosphoribosylformylglycinamidine synthase|nr:phosphoribosylformylglycinamidine synthase [Treponema sp.]
MTVRRVYVEKKEGFDVEARQLQTELAGFLGNQYPALACLKGLRILNRYDASGLDEVHFKRAVDLVFSEPQCDTTFIRDSVPAEKGDLFFTVEYLPGQYDQRSDSAEQCIELAAGIKPVIRSARVYIITPASVPLSDAALDAVKQYLINPVDSREAPEALPASPGEPEVRVEDVPVLTGFTAADGTEDLAKLAQEYGLAMSVEDLQFCRNHFISINRDPTLAELRVLDTYWSDHCRHTTFNTALEKIGISAGPLAPSLNNALVLYEEARREVYGDNAKNRKRSLMDMATIGAKVLKKRGLADDVDESDEINACTIKINAQFKDGTSEPWLLLFKNETHNHPTEIEPFGGAATCLGGAIRDPLSGRAYVHQAMRISGGGDPRVSMEETLPGKLPQIKIAREAAAGYSSYGNQIGIATGQVAEFYHPGFLAKRMELGGVIAAVPADWVRREEPAPGDLVILVGGKTGRDGIGGATGSSKVHTGVSVETAGAEVQKGNAVEERKLQRLFRNPRAAHLIKRCNDFGAGGVSVAVGELAAGLDINLDTVLKKYAGLNGIELAISESQERMAVVVAAGDAGAFIGAAAAENLDAVVIAQVSGSHDPHLRMSWRGKTIVDLSRQFLDTNGAPRQAEAFLSAGNFTTNSTKNMKKMGFEQAACRRQVTDTILDSLKKELSSLRSCSRRGLQECFDGSIGAASVLFPWGGKDQGTPECGMAALLPSRDLQSATASLMTFGYDPEQMEKNPYEGAKGSVREALAKFACLGGNPWNAYLSFQEYFERPESGESWGKPAAALLGALEAQLALGVPAIGGKDSMSGNYKASNINITVPPTLVAFAAGAAPAAAVRSGALSGETGNVIILFAQLTGNTASADKNEWKNFRDTMNALAALSGITASDGKSCIRSACPVCAGGAAVSLAMTAFGNNTGVEVKKSALLFAEAADFEKQGSVLVEIDRKIFANNVMASDIFMSLKSWKMFGTVITEPVFRIIDDIKGVTETKERRLSEAFTGAECSLAELKALYEAPLAKVYPQTSTEKINAPHLSPSNKPTVRLHLSRHITPLVVLPVFPGTNCEWDMEKSFREAGAQTRLVIFRNRNREDIAGSIRELAAAIGEAQIVALSGGFSAGDEPEGSGKFIANVLREAAIADAVTNLLEKRDGLMIGICNGFQALIKLGLVPCGTYRDADASAPTLTFNRIGRHVSRMVRTKVMSTLSPWLAQEQEGAVHLIPVSHGEGRLAIDPKEGEALFKTGQVPFCYVDAAGQPAGNEPDNPNGSDFAIEGLTSPDGRVLGKMGHSERCGEYVHINIPGNKKQNLFAAGVRYFT